MKDEDLEPGTTGFEFYFDAFAELSTSRQVGFAEGPIPFTAIAEYFRIYELIDFDEFAYLMRRMDWVYLELNAEKPAPPKAGGSNATGHRNTKNNRKG